MEYSTQAHHLGPAALPVVGRTTSRHAARVCDAIAYVLLLGVISNMLNMLRVDPFLQDIAFGLLIVLAIGVSWLRTRVGTEG